MSAKIYIVSMSAVHMQYTCVQRHVCKNILKTQRFISQNIVLLIYTEPQGIKGKICLFENYFRSTYVYNMYF